MNECLEVFKSFKKKTANDGLGYKWFDWFGYLTRNHELYQQGNLWPYGR